MPASKSCRQPACAQQDSDTKQDSRDFIVVAQSHIAGCAALFGVLELFFGREYRYGELEEETAAFQASTEPIDHYIEELTTHLTALEDFQVRVANALRRCAYLSGIAYACGETVLRSAIGREEKRLRCCGDILTSDLMIVSGLLTTVPLSSFIEPGLESSVSVAEQSHQPGATLSDAVMQQLDDAVAGIHGLIEDFTATVEAELVSPYLRQFAQYQVERLKYLLAVLQSTGAPIQ